MLQGNRAAHLQLLHILKLARVQPCSLSSTSAWPLAYTWHQEAPSNLMSRRGCSTVLQTHEAQMLQKV